MHLNRENENRELRTPAVVRVFVRKDGTTVKADSWFYEFVQANSGRSFYSFLDAKTAEELRSDIEELSTWYNAGNIGKDTLIKEYACSLQNGLGARFDYVYLRLETTDDTENGLALYQLVILDLLGTNTLLKHRKAALEKYRFFMTLKDENYFDYNRSTGNLSVYKYVNEISVKLFDGDIDDFAREMRPVFSGGDPQIVEKLLGLENIVKNTDTNFDYKLDVMDANGGKAHARVLGGIPIEQRNLVTGIFYMELGEEEAPYYLKPSALDPGTGLLNKRAATEFAQEKLGTANGKTCWVMMVDIDDFKQINDHFGHLQGDDVIRFVAGILKTEVDSKGFSGRFGGDEFFVFLDRISDREALKTLLKVVAKKVAVHYDPKFKVTLSIGVSCYPKDGTTLEELLAKADKGLYIAKEKGKNRHIIYDPDLHGNLEQGSMQSQAAAYAVTKEAAREKMAEVMMGLATEGYRFLTDNITLQREIRTLFDVDGFTVMTDGGKTILAREGKYISSPLLEDTAKNELKYLGEHGPRVRYVANNLNAIQVSDEASYNRFMRQEIGAAILCMEFVDDKLFSFVSFDIFNKKRKWGERDIDMLGLLGAVLCRLLVKEHEEKNK